LLELADLIEDEDKLKRELFKIERELKKLGLKETLREISQQIGELERNEKSTPAERKKLKQGQERFRDLSQELSGLEAE